MTQHEAIMKWCRNHKGITSYEAYDSLGITQLATRITELEARGTKFKRETIKKKNRYGENVRFVRYMLDD